MIARTLPGSNFSFLRGDHADVDRSVAADYSCSTTHGTPINTNGIVPAPQRRTASIDSGANGRVVDLIGIGAHLDLDVELMRQELLLDEDL